MAALSFYTYMLECRDGTFYTGWTTNLEKRIAVHNLGKGAKYTRIRRPVRLLGSWQFETKSEALKFEYWLKTLSRLAKTKFLALAREKQAQYFPLHTADAHCRMSTQV